MILRTISAEESSIASAHFEQMLTITRHPVFFFCSSFFFGVIASTIFPWNVSLIGHFTTCSFVGFLSPIYSILTGCLLET
ncbi:hypothetical protein BGY98DRAFT_985422 [Russula aff. rugulosa BPL654]|nr:hypothetical protein BGY98DRAFT_985422 [Russula aff. rugulosa BPL654]